MRPISMEEADFWAKFASPEPRDLHFIFDPALNLSAASDLEDVNAALLNLWAGDLSPEEETVSPKIATLSTETKAGMSLLRERLWTPEFGIMVEPAADVSTDDIRRALRKIALLDLPEGRTVQFRYYDPHSLQLVLDVLDDEQKQALFGGSISSLLFKRARGKLLVYRGAGNEPGR